MKLKKLLKYVNSSNMLVIFDSHTGISEKGVHVKEVEKKYLNSKVVYVSSYGADERCNCDYLSVIIASKGEN